MSSDLDKTSKASRGKRGRWLLASRREEIIEQQHNEIKKLESKYRKLYEGSPVMFRTINKEGRILDCNQAYVTGLGYSNKDEIIGHSIFEHVPSETAQALRESFEEWCRTGTVNNKEVWLKRKDGSKFPAMINANNLYDDDGNLVGSNTVIMDMTEIRRAREQLEKANKELIKTNEMKEEFVRIASHELRTPIQPILLAAETSLDYNDPAYQQAKWEIVVRQAKRLQQLANDILDVSRMESGNLAYDMRMESANELVAEIVDYAKSGIEGGGGVGNRDNKQHSVSIEVKKGGGAAAAYNVNNDDDDDDIVLFLDKSRMIQALTNIVNNSLKFTEQGKITIETGIITNAVGDGNDSNKKEEEKFFEIKISDTGTGISEDILPNLFGKFVTKTSGRDSNKHGTGLGLFITKKIIEAHGGEVFAYNNDNNKSKGKGSKEEGEKGATFVIRLPIPNKP